MPQEKKTTLTPEQRNRRFDETQPFAIGVNDFTKAKYFELHRQVRITDNVDTNPHMRFVKALSKNEPIRLEHLQQYKLLSTGDFTEDYDNNADAWIDAPVIVATNRERYSMIDTGARRFAKAKGKIVIRWPTHHLSWKHRSSLNPEALTDPCLFEYFVETANAYVAEEGVNKHLKIVNGLKVTYHSLRVEDPFDQQRLHQFVQTANAGEVLTLDNPPFAIDVQLTDRQHLTDKELDIVKTYSIGKDGNIILQVQEGHTREKDTDVPVQTEPGLLPARVTIKARFPIEPAFAITAHKAEGRTLKKVILSLSQRQGTKCGMERKALYVAFSRVRDGDNIRLLLTGLSTADKWQSLSYLFTVQDDRSTCAFLSGFSKPHDTNKGWRERSWDPEIALRTFRTR